MFYKSKLNWALGNTREASYQTQDAIGRSLTVHSKYDS